MVFFCFNKRNLYFVTLINFCSDFEKTRETGTIDFASIFNRLIKFLIFKMIFDEELRRKCSENLTNSLRKPFNFMGRCK